MARQLLNLSLKKISVIKSMFLIIFLFSTALGSKVFAQFNPGKIAVLVVGDGTTYAAGTAAPVFVKEFNLSGTGQTGTVRTSLPATAVGGTTAVNRALTQNISAISEGFLHLSVNRQFLTLTGYNVNAGTASVSSSSSATFPTNTRVVGKIGADGIADTRTTLHTFINSGTRGAVTVDGTGYWLSLAAGVSYVPDANITNAVVNLNSTLVRGIGIFNNQLYTSAASGSIRLAQVGSGLPTSTGQTLTNLPGFPTATTDPYGFVFLNTDAVAGPDVVYVASSNAAPAGIVKYTSADQGATWTAKGSLTGFGVGVTAVYNSCTGNADLYILSSTGANVKPTFLYKYTDIAAATSTLSLAINSGTLLATAAANTGFGGVAFTPGSTLNAPAMFTVTGGNGCAITGVNIGLSNSETGVTYQLFNGASPVGAAITGTGAAISFGNQTTAGTYTVVATNILTSCIATMSGSSVINALPTVSFTGLMASYCNNAPAVTLTGSPAGGTFSGPGISGNTFTPATIGAGGPYTITYSYTAVNGCSNSLSQTVTVNALPIVSFTGLQPSYCNNATAVTLTGSPAGGTFSGPGISGNTFDPATVGAGGPYTITYSYTDVNGCSNSSSQTVTVKSVPTIPVISVVLCAGSTLTVSPTNGLASLTWNLDGSPISTVFAAGAASGTTVAGGNGPGSGANQLDFPYGVSVDATGNIYVADTYNSRIQRWSPGATTGVTVAGVNGVGSAANQFDLAIGVTVDATGNIYVADYFNDRIQRWAPGATTGVTVAGGNGSGSGVNQLNGPAGVTVDATGNIYVADQVNHRIQRWAPGATTGVTVAGGNGPGSGANQLNYPFGLSVDANGNIYVADAFNDRIQRWSPGATTGVTVAGGNGYGPGADQLSYPYGVTVDATGNIYVADLDNHRIQRWAPGAITGVTVAGGNGSGSGANQLNYPTGVTVDGNGNIYIADAENHRIQRWAQTISNDSLPNAAAGSYTVSVTNSLGCSVTSDPYVISVINTALNGTYTINSGLPVSCTNYISMAAAISDLNIKGVSGNVLFNVASGHTETAPAGGLVINYCALNAVLKPSATQTVTFQGGAVAALITAPVGTSTSVDGIVKLVGADYISFNKIDLQESVANVDVTTQMEWGYALLKCDGNNGSGHNTISNCSVTLNKTNQLSRGIYSGNHTGTSVANLTYTGTAGDAIQVDSSRNGYNSLLSNIIQNVYSAIALSGNTATSGALSLNDTMNVVGNTGQGNIISNYGGSSAAAIAINLSGQRNTKVFGNSISGGVGNTSTVTGIQLQSGLWAEVKDNTVSLSSNATTSSVIGITCGLSGGSVAFPNTVTITGNTIQDINYTTATTGQLIGLTSSSGGTGSSITISNNTVQDNTLTGTGTLIGIVNTATSGTLVMNNNEVFGNVKSGTGTMTLLDAGSMGTTNTTTISNNTVHDNQITGASGIMNCTKAGSSQVTFTGNLVYNNSIPNTSGATASSMYGYNNGASPTVDNLTYNNVYNLSIGGAGTSTGHLIYGLYTFSISSTVKAITGNSIHDLSMAPAGNIRGIFHEAGSTVNINRNRIYGLSSTSTSASVLVEGIRINAGTSTRVYNNIIGNLTASAAASTDAIRAISSYSATANSTIGLYFNSIYLSGTSTGAGFGSTGIFHTTSTTATTAALDMRNNIVVNACTPTGTGRVVAYRRSSTSLTNFASSSNNNIYYVNAGASNHIYSDGTNHLGMAAYKAFAGISPRETSSQEENVAFQSTTGSDAAFLKVNTSIPTAVESGGQPISTITDDYFLTVRNTLVPDIGAYEDNFVKKFPVFVSLSASPATPQCVATARAITATIDWDYTPYIVDATLNYSWDGVPKPAIIMAFDYGYPLGTATATLPAPPPNVLVTWSVTISDYTYYTQTATGTSFTDAYLTSFSIAASANQTTVCAGSPVVLTGMIKGPVPVAPAASSYCASTHTSGCSGDEITNVTLGTINNTTSGCGGASHYTYFNGGGTQTTSLAANVSHTLSVSFGSHNSQYFGAWIDYDHNGTYDVSEFLGASGNAGSNGTIAISFTVPVTAYNGLTHIRIVGGNDAAVTATQACGASSSTWGETQDYDVTITGAEPGFVLPVTYSWKDAGNNIISTVNPATFTPSATSSYTLTVSDANGCSLVSSPVFVTVSPLLSYNISGNLEFCEGGSTTLTVGPLSARYANSVIAFSSEYSPSPGGWSAAAALGIQDVYPAYGDISNSWASADADNQREYLVLGFADAAPVNFIDIYETYKPGSVDTVYVKNPITGLFEIVYTTTASIQPDVARKLHITFPLTAFPVSEIRIAMNSPAVPDWNEIDAVAIGNRSILWSTGETTESIVVTASGNYSVTVSNGCTASASVSVVETSLDFVNLQWPPIASVCQGADFTAYGLVGEAGVTGTYGVPGPGITAEFGYSTSNTDPSTWTNWVPATFNALATWQPADEYFANFGSTLAPGIYYYTFRYTLNGCGYQYGGYSVGGGGTWDGINYLNGTLTVNVCSPNTTLNLTAFLEGFYSDINTMRANIYDLGISTNPTETDTVTVNLWSTASLSNPEPDHSIQAVIHTDGTASMQFPAGVAGNEYYIAVKHRNHLETWSKLPVMFTSTTAYDFSSAMAQAYDDGVNPPMASVAGGKFAFYGGDVNQDGGIDASDQGDVDNDVSLFAFGYNTTDATGDGSTDASDMQVVDNNLPLFLFYARPY